MKYEFSGKIRYSELDEGGKLSPGSLVNYFQDVSTFQSEYLGVGLEYLKQHKVAWILSSWQIVIRRMPGLGEEVTAQTWPYGFKEFFGLRNFTLLDEKRELLALANSMWVLFDLEKQRPARPDPVMVEKYEKEKKLDMEYAPRKIAIPAEGTWDTPFLIGKQNLDTNHHVNNGQYIALASAYLPERFAVHQIRAEYKKQARLHDEIRPLISRQEETVTVQLCSSGGEPYAVVEFQT